MNRVFGQPRPEERPDVLPNFDYEGFGGRLGAGAAATDYLFAGEQFDADLGISVNRARYYDQQAGRFTTIDKFGGQPSEPQSFHKYVYCRNEPTGKIDPSGYLYSVGDFLAATYVRGILWAPTISYYAALTTAVSGSLFLASAGIIQTYESNDTQAPGAFYVVNHVSGGLFFLGIFAYEGAAPFAAMSPGKARSYGIKPTQRLQRPVLRLDALEDGEDAYFLGKAVEQTGGRLVYMGSATSKTRENNLRGIPTKTGFDRGENPPASTLEGQNATVRYTDPSSNRRVGAKLGNFYRGNNLADGDEFEVVVTNMDKVQR